MTELADTAVIEMPPPRPQPVAVAPTLYLGLPCRPGARSLSEGFPVKRPTRRCRVQIGQAGGSLLNLNFNTLWAAAMNRRAESNLTYFGLIHDDIDAPVDWADVLIEELERNDADIVSAVIPLKDRRGLTSTGIHSDKSGNIRRLTMAEVMALPETFGLADLHAAGITAHGPAGGTMAAVETLLVNTGLFVCRIDRSWVEIFPGFRNGFDGVSRQAGGQYVPVCLPEDWTWSIWANRHGLKVLATRKVALAHVGGTEADPIRYRNDHVWGECLTDEGDPKRG